MCVLYAPEHGNRLPHYKILDLSKLKTFADNNMNVTQNRNSFWDGKKTWWEMEKMLDLLQSSIDLNFHHTIPSFNRDHRRYPYNYMYIRSLL